MRPIPFAIIEPFLVRVEGEILRVYDDKHPKRILKPGDVVEGVLTGGVGHTGADVEIGREVTKALSRKWLQSDLVEKAQKPLYRKIGKVVDALTDHQYAALLSFVFNLGTGHPKRTEWTIWKRLRAGQLDQVPIEMMKFVNWNGKRATGLVRRRTAEVELWHTGDPLTDDVAPPSAVTRTSPTPPTPATPRGLTSGPILTAAATATAAGASAVSQVSEALQPASYVSDHVMRIVGWLAIAAAVLSVVTLVVNWLKNRAERN